MHPDRPLKPARHGFPPATGLSHPAFPLAGIALALTLVAAEPLRSAGFCLPLICGFGEGGKKGGGRYIDTKVTPQKLAELDATISSGIASGMLKAAGSTQRPEFQGYGLEMPKAEAALQAILDRIREDWHYRKPPLITVKIVGSPTRVPLAHADGVILVPLGMLINAETDDQIAWLLAHEYSHIALGHFALEAKRKASQKQMSTLMSLVPLGVEMAQQKVEMVNGRPTFTKVANPDVVEAGEMLQYRSNDLRMVFGLINSFFSRQQEDQADVAGLDLVIAAHYDHGGSTTAVQMIAKDEQQVQDFMTAFGKDFSAFSEKQAGAMATQALTDAQAGKSGKDIVGGLLKSLGRNAGRIALNKLNDAYSRSHRPPDKRGEGILKYYRNVHEGKSPPAESTNTVLQNLHALPEYIEARAAIESMHIAMDIIAKQGPAMDALAAIRPALKTRYVNTPVVANGVAQLYAYAKQYPAAEKWFDIASGMNAMRTPAPAPAARGKGRKARPAAAPVAKPVLSPGASAVVTSIYAQSVAGYDLHIGFLINQQKYARALAVIEVAAKRLSDDDAFLPSLVLIHGKMRQTEKMAQALQRCAALEDPVLSGKCRKAFMETMFAPGAYEALSPADRAVVDREYLKVETTARSGDIWQKIADSVSTNEDDDEPKRK